MNIGTGFLIERNNRGYLATCAHTFTECSFGTTFCVAISASEPTSDARTAEIFGSANRDPSGEDLCFIPVLKPNAIGALGKLFLPLRPLPDVGSILHIASGYPGALEEVVSQTKIVPNGCHVTPSRSIHLLEENSRAPEHFPKLPHWQFAVSVEPFYKDGNEPESMMGMSGGPVWRLFNDKSVSPVGIFLQETNWALPRELKAYALQYLEQFIQIWEASL